MSYSNFCHLTLLVLRVRSSSSVTDSFNYSLKLVSEIRLSIRLTIFCPIQSQDLVPALHQFTNTFVTKKKPPCYLIDSEDFTLFQELGKFLTFLKLACVSVTHLFF